MVFDKEVSLAIPLAIQDAWQKYAFIYEHKFYAYIHFKGIRICFNGLKIENNQIILLFNQIEIAEISVAYRISKVAHETNENAYHFFTD